MHICSCCSFSSLFFFFFVHLNALKPSNSEGRIVLRRRPTKQPPPLQPGVSRCVSFLLQPQLCFSSSARRLFGSWHQRGACFDIYEVRCVVPVHRHVQPEVGNNQVQMLCYCASFADDFRLGLATSVHNYLLLDVGETCSLFLCSKVYKNTNSFQGF